MNPQINKRFETLGWCWPYQEPKLVKTLAFSWYQIQNCRPLPGPVLLGNQSKALGSVVVLRTCSPMGVKVWCNKKIACQAAPELHHRNKLPTTTICKTLPESNPGPVLPLENKRKTLGWWWWSYQKPIPCSSRFNAVGVKTDIKGEHGVFFSFLFLKNSFCWGETCSWWRPSPAITILSSPVKSCMCRINLALQILNGGLQFVDGVVRHFLSCFHHWQLKSQIHDFLMERHEFNSTMTLM